MEYGYDAIGRPTFTKVNTATQFETSYQYVPGNDGSTTTQMASITNKNDTLSYTYDANWNIKTITVGTKVVSYYYDQLNQLIREDNEFLGPSGKTILYEYDGGSNILLKTEYAYTTGTPENPTGYFTYRYDDLWKDKLVSYNGSNITYDQIGNPLSDGKYTYTWT